MTRVSIIFRATVPIAALVIGVLGGAFALSAYASTTSHTTSGSGSHTDESHEANNPSHIFVAVGAPTSGDGADGISSGGRLHDLDEFETCCIAPLAGDWALDIDNPNEEGTASKLYLDYGGYGADGDPTLDITSSSVTLWAKVTGTGGSGACEWQEYTVLARYYGNNGVFYDQVPVGTVSIMHQTGWTYDEEDMIYANASRSVGSLTVYYINGITVGEVFDGSSGCSSGAHTHVEVYNNHNWGIQYEFHGWGPDYYSGAHTHNAASGNPPASCPGANNGYTDGCDTVSQGSTVGFLGGATYSYKLS